FQSHMAAATIAEITATTTPTVPVAAPAMTVKAMRTIFANLIKMGTRRTIQLQSVARKDSKLEAKGRILAKMGPNLEKAEIKVPIPLTMEPITFNTGPIAASKVVNPMIVFCVAGLSSPNFLTNSVNFSNIGVITGKTWSLIAIPKPSRADINSLKLPLVLSDMVFAICLAVPSDSLSILVNLTNSFSPACKRIAIAGPASTPTSSIASAALTPASRKVLMISASDLVLGLTSSAVNPYFSSAFLVLPVTLDNWAKIPRNAVPARSP